MAEKTLGVRAARDIVQENMTNYPDILKSLAWRILLASPCFAIGVTGALSVLSPFFTVAGAIIVAMPLARLIAEPAGGLFLPTRRLSRKLPMYSIPQSRRAKGLYEEAMAGFEKIAQDYPGELEPYIEMIDIAILDLKDPDRASRIYQQGVSRLKKDGDKEALERMYTAIRSRLNARPSN